ncbi:hypothetical protein GCM10009111_34430 [Colwellia asteriadis]|uniref:Uncharacterized protein n=1 Tax=Colwellia asteriadis TaxID=517723 RepID=A0ABP3WKQ5_9GAMM
MIETDEGIVTFFYFNNLGFYQVGTDYSEPIGIELILDSLTDWHDRMDSLAETSPYNKKNRKSVYLKAIDKNEETGDYLVTLWKSINTDDGSVFGLRADRAPSDNTIVNADEANEEKVIWGKPAYYWFIPTLNVFASIKFNNTLTDADVLNSYLKDYVQFRSNINGPIIEGKVNKAGEEYEAVHWKGPHGNLWLRIDSRRYTKITKNADLSLIAKDITHFVKKEEIITSAKQPDDWTRYFKGLPFISKRGGDGSRSVSVVVDARPTGKELKAMMETYHQNYGTSKNKKSNLGFRKEGTGSQTYWLDEFIVKSGLTVPITNTSHYSHKTLFSSIKVDRNNLLAQFTVEDVAEKAVVE